jgi:hypothetical protein
MQIKFKTGNAAFEEYGYWKEIDRILKSISDKVRLSYDHGSIMDINGNKIGAWSL